MVRTKHFFLGFAGLFFMAVSPTWADLVSNGSFELYSTTNVSGSGPGYYTYDTSHQGLTNWTVVSGDVDVVQNTLWPPADLLVSLDSNGLSEGEIAQSFSTVIGSTYTLSFEYANNPGTGTAELQATVSGATTDLQTIVSHSGSTPLNMGWTLYSNTFTANASTTTIDFASLTPGNAGVTLDAVVVDPTPEPISILLLLTVGSGVAFGFRRKLAL